MYYVHIYVERKTDGQSVSTCCPSVAASAQATARKKKKPNALIRFAAHYRPCFVHVLKEASEV